MAAASDRLEGMVRASALKPSDVADFFIGILSGDALAKQMAQRLYLSEGYHIISRLAPLGFEDARRTIADVVGQDIFEQFLRD